MNRIERITKMEKNLDDSIEAITEFSAALDKYEYTQKAWNELLDYYGSKRWMRDFEADEAGKLPPELKRGVLSEDMVYELILINHEINVRMLSLLRDAAARGNI